MILPAGFFSFKGAMWVVSYFCYLLKYAIKEKYGPNATNVGGFTKSIWWNEEGIVLLGTAVEKKGYTGETFLKVNTEYMRYPTAKFPHLDLVTVLELIKEIAELMTRQVRVFHSNLAEVPTYEHLQFEVSLFYMVIKHKGRWLSHGQSARNVETGGCRSCF
jgi:hypothetical protein